MSEPDTTPLEETAYQYEGRLVPVLFQPFAELIADRLDVQASSIVLDVGCGTGVLARQLVARGGPPAGITGFDANPGMLSVARAREPAIEWALGDVRDMPFANETFDVVASQFALMLFDDRLAALREMSRVLKGDGQLCVTVFEGFAVNRGYQQITAAYERELGPDIANTLRFPFSFGDLDALERLFVAAGLPEPGREAVSVTAKFDNAMALALSDVKGWFPFAGLALTDAEIDRVARSLDAEFGAEGGVVSFDVHAHFLTTQKAAS